MPRAILLGTVAALIFASTFVLNTRIAAQGGHWYWTALLRYAYVFIIVSGVLVAQGGVSALVASWRCYWMHRSLWTAAGCIGFGAFYSAICFAGVYLDGWMVAATWQSTVLATPVVLRLFGQRVPLTTFLFSALAFLGAALVAVGGRTLSIDRSSLALLLVLAAAFCYPIGNTLVKNATAPETGRAAIAEPIARNTMARIWMQTLGAFPWFGLVGVAVRPPWPTISQLLLTLLVAATTGVLATWLFLRARQRAVTPSATAAVDATQSAEPPFALAMESAMRAGAPPTPLGIVGLGLIVLGVVAPLLAALYQARASARRRE